MRLAIETGVHWRAWLEDPPAMATATEILNEQAQRIEERTNRQS